MCGRYYIPEEDSSEEIARIIEEINRERHHPEMKTYGEVFPSDTVPVLAHNRKRMLRGFAMRWGYSAPDGKLLINARVETAAEKPMFRDGMKQRRCLIPASHYFEWERREGKKTKYAIRPVGSELLYLAGIYRLEQRGGDITTAFTVLTREAAPEIAFIHPRMPVMLPRELAEDWLDPANDAVEVARDALIVPEYARA